MNLVYEAGGTANNQQKWLAVQRNVPIYQRTEHRKDHAIKPDSVITSNACFDVKIQATFDPRITRTL